MNKTEAEMKSKKYDIEKMCRTCEHAELLVDTDKVLCERKGIVPADNVCRKFIYDALKRVPSKNNPQAPKLEYIDIDGKE